MRKYKKTDSFISEMSIRARDAVKYIRSIEKLDFFILTFTDDPDVEYYGFSCGECDEIDLYFSVRMLERHIIDRADYLKNGGDDIYD